MEKKLKKNAFLEELRKEIKPEDTIFTTYYYDLLIKIHEILDVKGWTQKSFADRLEKSPSEISKWLNGGHNLTLKSIAKMEAVLEEKLLEVPQYINVTNTEMNTKVDLSNNLVYGSYNSLVIKETDNQSLIAA